MRNFCRFFLAQTLTIACFMPRPYGAQAMLLTNSAMDEFQVAAFPPEPAEISSRRKEKSPNVRRFAGFPLADKRYSNLWIINTRTEPIPSPANHRHRRRDASPPLVARERPALGILSDGLTAKQQLYVPLDGYRPEPARITNLEQGPPTPSPGPPDGKNALLLVLSFQGKGSAYSPICT